MRILCGVLTAFACGMLSFVIAASGHDLAMLSVPFTFYGGTGLVLLWLAGGQPSSFSTTTASSELATRQRRLRRAMRVAAGVFGVIMGWMLVGFGTTITWRAVVAIRTGTAEIGDVLTPVWYVLQALAAWVLLPFAFRGRPLPPTRPALTAATPSSDPATTGNAAEPEDGSIRARMHYANGVAEGEATTYDAAGNLTNVETYSQGKPTGQSDSPGTRPAE